MSDLSDNLQFGDLDDYVAECDEHLINAREELLDLERSPDPGATGRERLDALFRAFHTIKGLSGMVGAATVEGAAHHMESYLAAVRKREILLTKPGIDALLDGVRYIEAAIERFTRSEPSQDSSALIARLCGLTERSTAGPAADTGHALTLDDERQAKLDAAFARGERAWLVTFTPSPVLAARGVSVGTVRSRLQAVGDIIQAAPAAKEGSLSFHFLVCAPADANLRGAPENGIEVEPYHAAGAELAHPANAAPDGGQTPFAPTQLVRVDLDRLDELLRSVGELVLSRARLEMTIARLAVDLPAAARRELDETLHTIERQLRELREGVMRVRMVPVRDLFLRMRHVVRDLTRATGKLVELSMDGEGTEIDKFVIERIADPLLHLVRNAMSHGIEPPDAREAAGKPREGRLKLRAVASGGMIQLEIEDDGAGVNPEEVFARARHMGFISPDAREDAASLLDLLCAPGFSTRDEADRASGRGVGLNVVRIAIESLGGSLSLDTRRGAGSVFTIRLPLTLVVADVLTISVGQETFAIPQTAVREVVSLEPGAATLMENNELIRYHSDVIPLIRLSEVFGGERRNGAHVGLVTGEGKAAVALVADRAVGLHEVVVRPLADPLLQVPGISGATELGDGRPVLLLDPAGIARLARRRIRATRAERGRVDGRVTVN